MKNRPSGAPAFGATYMYGQDPDGPAYSIALSADLPADELRRALRWNFRRNESGTLIYLTRSEDRSVQLAAAQIRITARSVVDELILSQKQVDRRSPLDLVFTDENDQVVYYLPLADLCASHPGNFKNLSDSKRCDQITALDLQP